MNLTLLNDKYYDVFKELGNIGSGNAVTALSSMIGKKIKVKVPTVKLLEFKDFQNFYDSPENVIIGIYFDLNGDINGNIIFTLDLISAKYIIRNLLNICVHDEFNEIEKSALEELGNIMVGSYITSLSALTSLKIKVTPPAISIDMSGAILSVPAIKSGEISDKILFIETGFSEGKKLMRGNIFLIPDIESSFKMLNSLGVEIDG